ncbi:hypothetical protein WN55_08805 [Dufourea novaeangliae]|uniref:Uncharacterized protein n=1 Tax=Dufourea novaeangliae TaxID=178035 RepID=A0A154P1U1_DUFNO|nr:hypothetical protein WN55_08805 [Dufourea novaeangliae]
MRNGYGFNGFMVQASSRSKDSNLLRPRLRVRGEVSRLLKSEIFVAVVNWSPLMRRR